MKKRNTNDGMHTLLTDRLQLPMDLSDGIIGVRVIGTEQVWVENYHRIMDCMEEKITISGKGCLLAIKGKQLQIQYYSDENMLLCGRIHSLEYMVCEDI